MPTVLLVSHDESLRAHGEAVLRRLNFTVEDTDDERIALALALQHGCQGAVLAIARGQADGFPLCELLRCDPGTSTLPVIALTNDESCGFDALRAGASAVLTPQSSDDEWQRALMPPTASRHRDIVSPRTDRRRRLRRVTIRTTTPPMPPSALSCPSCRRRLRYCFSDVSGAEQVEQWDRFTCSRCGDCQYRPRSGAFTWLPSPRVGR